MISLKEAAKSCLPCVHLFSKTRYHNLICIYVNVASLEKDNLSNAKIICNQLKDERLVGECSFYMALSFAWDMEVNTSEKIKTYKYNSKY